MTMLDETVRERKVKHRYTLVVVPEEKSEKTRSFSATVIGVVGLGAAILIVIVAMVLALVIYTPLGSQLPIAHPELAQYYGRQIGEIQRQMDYLIREVTTLRTYNLRLRKAMGEKVTIPDSGMDAGSSSNVGDQLIVDAPANSRQVRTDKLQSTGNTSPQIPPAGNGTVVSARMSRREFSPKLPLIPPADGYLAREFDPEQYHYGVDFAGKKGSAIQAAADGTVVFAGWTYNDGYTIILVHTEGYMTVYKHNQSLVKTTGETVRRGEMIALLGNTGETSSGPHLHFEVWKDGVVQNPNNYLLSMQ
jgi:murein DD-endopeptidase MepM/ murein hydrolase activator NlpD